MNKVIFKLFVIFIIFVTKINCMISSINCEEDSDAEIDNKNFTTRSNLYVQCPEWARPKFQCKHIKNLLICIKSLDCELTKIMQLSNRNSILPNSTDLSYSNKSEKIMQDNNYTSINPRSFFSGINFGLGRPGCNCLPPQGCFCPMCLCNCPICYPCSRAVSVTCPVCNECSSTCNCPLHICDCPPSSKWISSSGFKCNYIFDSIVCAKISKCPGVESVDKGKDNDKTKEENDNKKEEKHDNKKEEKNDDKKEDKNDNKKEDKNDDKKMDKDNGYYKVENDDKFPWLVYIKTMRTNFDRICTGSLITNSHVLTVGDCVSNTEYVIVGLGSANRKTPRIQQTCKKFIIHDDFEAGTSTDLALIKLPTSIKPPDGIKPITLARPRMNYEYLVNKLCMIAGWGIYSEINCQKCLYYMYTTIKHYSKCMSGMICVGSGLTSFKSEGIGGALVLEENGKTYLVGVISAFHPDVSVAYNLKWIQQKTGIRDWNKM